MNRESFQLQTTIKSYASFPGTKMILKDLCKDINLSVTSPAMGK